MVVSEGDYGDVSVDAVSVAMSFLCGDVVVGARIVMCQYVP